MVGKVDCGYNIFILFPFNFKHKRENKGNIKRKKNQNAIYTFMVSHWLQTAFNKKEEENRNQIAT